MATIVNPDSKTIAIFLKAHLKMIACGLKPRGRKGDYLKKASELTGKRYKRGEYLAAVKDLEEFINE